MDQRGKMPLFASHHSDTLTQTTPDTLFFTTICFALQPTEKCSDFLFPLVDHSFLTVSAELVECGSDR